MKRTRLLIVAIALLLGVVNLLFSFAPTAHAAEQRRGFFTRAYTTDPVITVVQNGVPDWVVTKDDFKKWVKEDLFKGDERSQTAGDFIVRLMLSGTSNHSRPDEDDVDEWERRLDSPNIVMNPHVNYHFYQNSGYFDNDMDDVSLYDYEDRQDSIVFYDSTGRDLFAVKRSCGNPVGDPIPLPEADEAPTITADKPNCTDRILTGEAKDPDYVGSLSVRIYRNGSLVDTVKTKYDRKKKTYIYTYTIPSASAAVGASYEARVTSVDSDGDTISGGTVASARQSLGPCNDGSCGSRVNVDVTAGTTETLNLEAIVNFWVSPQFITPTNPRFSVSITSPAGVVTTRNNVAYSVSGTGNVRANAILRTSLSHTFVTAGLYQVKWSLSGSSDDTRIVNVTCDGAAGGDGGGGTVTAGDKPYFEVKGGDIIAGISFPNDGGAPDAVSSVIASWDSGSAPYDGAKGNLAVIAGGTVTQFSSGADSSNPSRLTFANTTGSGYGGGFSELPSVPNYIDNALATVESPTCPGLPIDLVHLSSGVYHCAGNVTISGGVLDPGKNVTIIADGSVFISGNITYSYSGLTDIPRLNVYTRGDIVVAGGVSELHGVFVAQGKDKKFYSCGGSATDGYEYSSLSAHSGECANRLTVYGSVVAGELVLGRTSGSWLRPAEGPAETFVHSPETWLGRPITSGAGAAQNEFDSYISLPPVL